MATELAALVNPGVFKARKKDPERMLTDFNLYMKSFSDFLVVTDNMEAANAKKKSLLRAVGGPDMVFLFDHIGKVADGANYNEAIAAIRTAITGQTNQAMIRFKLFTGMGQDDEPFSSWWAKVKEQAEKCSFDDYDVNAAARDAILFQTSDSRLRKKVLAEDYGLEETVKLGLAYEQTNTKAAAMGSNKDEKARSSVRRLVEEEVARLSLSPGGSSEKVKCQTCSGKHKVGFNCPGKKCQKCFDCGEKGHFKGAPICKTPKNKKPVKKLGGGKFDKSRRVKSDESSGDTDDTDDELSDSCGRVTEVVARSSQGVMAEPKVCVSVRARGGNEYLDFKWLPDSGVCRTLITEKHWKRLLAINPSMKLKKNKVKFTPYATDNSLIVLGKAKVVLRNLNDRKVKAMVYVVRGAKESLLGRRDGEALGIISIESKGLPPKDDVCRLQMMVKPVEEAVAIVSGNQTQQQIDAKLNKLVDRYPGVFSGIGRIKLDPIHIHRKEGGRSPVAQKLRPVALHLMEPLKKHLDELVEGGVIEGPLGSEYATGWVSNMVIVAKKWDPSKIRVTLDTRLMADSIMQTHFPIPTPEQLRHEFRGSDRFTMLDLNHAFHQMELDEESSKMFVFTTPFGLFRFKRLVQGISPASAECHQKLKNVLSGIDGVVQIKDDWTVHGKGEIHDARLEQVLDRCQEYGITLRREKCFFGQPQVCWFGNIYSKHGMSPDPRKVDMIKRWPEPEDKAAVKSFLQTVQFCSTFMRPGNGRTYSDVTKPLRMLTRQGVRFVWDDSCKKSFQELKNLLSDSSVMVNFDTGRHTRLYVDHGPGGVAATVAQRYEDEKTGDVVYRPVHHNSRALTETEAKYGKVEGESLAVAFGVKSNRTYLYGSKFEVVVDHKPLVPLYNSVARPSPIRVDRHKSKLLAFDFTLVYEPGYKNPCDYASRHPDNLDKQMSVAQKDELCVEDEAEDSVFSVNRIIDHDIKGAITKDILIRETESDDELKQLLEDVARGKLSDQLQGSPYAKVFEELTACDGVLLKSDRVVIPKNLTEQVIELAHESHGLGETKTIRMLRERVWFPKLAKKAKEYVAKCYPCAVAVPRNDPVPIQNRELPKGPWKEVAVDYKGPIGGPRGFYYHVIVDLYSRYPEIFIVPDTTFESLRPKLEEVWARLGIPEKIIHDGGAPYNSHEWKLYAQEKGYELELCTPEHPQSNGMAEKMMASLAKITHAALAEGVKPRDVLQTFLISYRSTPHGSTGKSPSQLLMNRELKTKVPNIDSVKKGSSDNSVEEIDTAEKVKHKKYADKRRRARDRSINVGDQVLVKQKKTTTRPPWDPIPYLVENVKNSKIFLTRNGRSKVRNIEKCKLLRGPKIRAVTSDFDGDDDDWEIDVSRLGGRLLDHHVDVLIEDNQMMMPEEDEYQEEHELYNDAFNDIQERQDDLVQVPVEGLRRSNRVKKAPNRHKDFESWENIEARNGRQNGPSPRQRKRKQADARYKKNRPAGDETENEGLENE